jgi:murein DD-endopeptidase MepM/ murein hydrolase activator NlpD
MSRDHDKIRKLVRSIILEDIAPTRPANIYITSTGKQYAVPTFKSDQGAQNTDDLEDDSKSSEDAQDVPDAKAPEPDAANDKDVSPAASPTATTTPNPPTSAPYVVPIVRRDIFSTGPVKTTAAPPVSGVRTKLIAGAVLGMPEDATTAKAWANKSGITLTGLFGDRRGDHNHQGIDITYSGGGIKGADVYSIDGGIVINSDEIGKTPAGKFVSVEHGNGKISNYLHLDSVSVGEKQPITKGAVIGKVGNTGRSTGPHLHFQIKDKDGKAIDPIEVFRNNIMLTFPVPAIKQQ